MMTMDASFTPWNTFSTGSRYSGLMVLMAAPKMIVKTIRGSRSMFAAAAMGLRGIMLRSVSTVDGAWAARSMLAWASPP